MLHGLALPSVGDVHLAVAGLDDGGVGIFAGGALEGEDWFPAFAIGRDCNIEHVTT